MTIIFVKRSLIRDGWRQNHCRYSLGFWSRSKPILLLFIVQWQLFKPSSY